MNGRRTPRLAVGRQEAEEEGYFYQAVECVFDQICSLGLYVIRYVMFLCFLVQFRTKQTKCFLAYVMLNIVCLYVFMFSGMLHTITILLSIIEIVTVCIFWHVPAEFCWRRSFAGTNFISKTVPAKFKMRSGERSEL